MVNEVYSDVFIYVPVVDPVFRRRPVDIPSLDIKFCL
jgi:hypothetical protein